MSPVRSSTRVGSIFSPGRELSPIFDSQNGHFATTEIDPVVVEFEVAVAHLRPAGWEVFAVALAVIGPAAADFSGRPGRGWRLVRHAVVIAGGVGRVVGPVEEDRDRCLVCTGEQVKR
jgi:hypothetical protein